MTKTATHIRLLLVDDHAMVRSGLAYQLAMATDLTVVGQAASGEEGLMLARELAPDVVLMDLRMPGIGGYEAAKRIKAAVDDCVVIAVTAANDEPDGRLRKNGISACVNKAAEPDELIQIVRDTYLMRTDESVDGEYRIADVVSESPFHNLTGREMQMISLTLEGLSPAEMADMLCLSVKSVYTYRYRIYDKLGVRNEIELINLAKRYGIESV